MQCGDCRDIAIEVHRQVRSHAKNHFDVEQTSVRVGGPEVLRDMVLLSLSGLVVTSG
jgi:hypothetical protein